MTSVNKSDQACAKYIIVVLMQVPGVGSSVFQFSEMGRHCRRFATKNATVHVMVKPIMAHEIVENVLIAKILM